MSYDRDQYRTRQMEDYISVFYPELNKEMADCSVLDVGCGRGVVSLGIAPYAKSVLGLDLDENCIRYLNEKVECEGIPNARFARMSAYDLRPDELYDVVILSDVLEHVPDPRLLLQRCLDVMSPEGVMYLNTPNRWFPMEPHKRLPFLSYLPKSIATPYCKAFGKGSYDDYHLLGYRGFVDLLDTLPLRFTFKTQSNPCRMMYRIGGPLVTKAPFLWRFANAFQVIVRHDHGTRNI